MSDAYNDKTILIVDIDMARAGKTRQALDAKLGSGHGFNFILASSHMEANNIYDFMTQQEITPAAIVLDDYYSTAGMDSFRFADNIKSSQLPTKWASVKQAKPTPVYMLAQGEIYKPEVEARGIPADRYHVVRDEAGLAVAAENIAAGIKRFRQAARGEGKREV